MTIGHCQARAAIVLAVLLVLSYGATARADELRSKGTVLTGTVKHVSPKEVAFDTEYGEGTIVVKIEDVEDLKSDGRFIVMHGPSGKTSGRIFGLHDGKLVVGDDEASATEIDVADVHAFVSIEGPDDTFANNMRRRLALWDGAFDLGFGVTRATTDTTTFNVGFLADRKKKPTRLTFETGYVYGTQKDDDGEENLTEKEATAMLRGEYDFAAQWFTFGSIDAEYDRVEHLDIRTVPKAGVGYRFWEAENGLFQVEVGGAYVYEKFDGGDENDYFSIVLGKLLEYDLPYFGSHFHWRTDFLPAIDDWSDYLVRSEAALLVPMYKYLNLKFAVEDEYDKTPAEDTEKNNFKSTLGLALVY
jgi:putative salt-induced outer membrane protein YdiY